MEVLLVVLLAIIGWSTGVIWEHQSAQRPGHFGSRRLHRPGEDCVSRGVYLTAEAQRDAWRERMALNKFGGYTTEELDARLDRMKAQLDEAEEDMADKPAYRSTMSKSDCGAYPAHQIRTNQVLSYLAKNPTLDASKPPMTWCDIANGYYVSCNPARYGYGDGDGKKAKAWEKSHTVSMDELRAHIMQHPQLRVVFEGQTKTEIVEKLVEVEKIVEVYMPLGAAERAEMTLALQRQQHIRNEYIRRAYVARERSTGTGNEAVYQRELDAQIEGMVVLRSLMERLEIPMADWMDKELALAQLDMLEGKEGADALYVPVSGSDGEGGLAPRPD